MFRRSGSCSGGTRDRVNGHGEIANMARSGEMVPLRALPQAPSRS
jgi:hypothetical protein